MNGRYKDGNLHVINTLYGRFFSFRRYKCPFVIRASVIDAPHCSSNNHGNERLFVSFERTDIIQISNITFYYNRFSVLNIDSKKSMGRFRIQLLLDNNTWSTRYNIPKNDRYSDSSTQWTLVNLNFTVENYGIKLIYDQIDTPHADMCFSNITITHSVY